ncbi:hypothetical protein WT97_02280 [Burkholderia sp. MSMB1459WGS]|nr:hypothetical protein WT97_02280 [Burkholderia sp. MSMB1459WGS]
MGNASGFQVIIKTGVGKCTPRSFGHEVILRLLIQLWKQVGPIRWELVPSMALLRSARRYTDDIDQNHRKAMSTKDLGKTTSIL